MYLRIVEFYVTAQLEAKMDDRCQPITACCNA